MEFKQLEAFVAVVENKSFSEAARQLNLTQPTISAHIQSLEQELNSLAADPHHQEADHHPKRTSDFVTVLPTF
ncbi:MAG: LysR family transcriptional regulator [Ruminococcus sp.]